MIKLGILGGLGAPEILILLILIFFVILCPVMWVREYHKRKFWQYKADHLEKMLAEKK